MKTLTFYLPIAMKGRFAVNFSTVLSGKKFPFSTSTCKVATMKRGVENVSMHYYRWLAGRASGWVHKLV